MSTDPVRVPDGKEADAHWARLPLRTRWAMLFQGKDPTDREEAVTVLAYGRRMRERSLLLGLVAGMGAIAVGVGLAMLTEDRLGAESFLRAAGIGLGVGLGIGVGARVFGRNLEGRSGILSGG